MTGSYKYNQIPLWKRMTLVTAMLFSGGSTAALVPSQAAYANSNRPHTHHQTRQGHSTRTRSGSIKLLIICKTGNGGKGGSAISKSSGATGGSGGNCIINVPINVFLTIPTIHTINNALQRHIMPLWRKFAYGIFLVV